MGVSLGSENQENFLWVAWSVASPKDLATSLRRARGSPRQVLTETVVGGGGLPKTNSKEKGNGSRGEGKKAEQPLTGNSSTDGTGLAHRPAGWC